MSVAAGMQEYFIEHLELRRLMSLALGANLITNPGAELGPVATNSTQIVTPQSWSTKAVQGNADSFSAAAYGMTSWFPTTTSPGAHGHRLFAGGPGGGVTRATQVIDISSIAADVNAGRISAALSGWLGGTTDEPDFMNLRLQFLNDAFAKTGSELSAGPVTAQDRGNVTELLKRSVAGAVPPGTTRLVVILDSTRFSGGYDDGFADDLALTLRSSLGTKGQIAGFVSDDANANAVIDAGESGMEGVRVFLDFNHDGQLDEHEWFTDTDDRGAYSFTKLTPGTYFVSVEVPDDFRASRINPIKSTVIAGLTSSRVNFPLAPATSSAGPLAGATSAAKFHESEIFADVLLVE